MYLNLWYSFLVIGPIFYPVIYFTFFFKKIDNYIKLDKEEKMVVGLLSIIVGGALNVSLAFMTFAIVKIWS